MSLVYRVKKELGLNVTGPAKIGHVGTMSLNTPYLNT